MGRNRRPSWGGRPLNDHATEGASSSASSAGLLNVRDGHATQSVCYVSDGRQRQVELKVPLLQIPKLFQRPPHAKESRYKMAVSEPPGQGSEKSDAVPSKAESAPKAAPKESKASVPTEAEASNQAVAALSSKAPKANSSNAGEGEHAVVVPKPVSVEESQTNEFKPPQANGKAVSEPPSRVSNAEVNPSVARKTDHTATKSQKLGASPVASSKPIPESESSAPPSQVSTVKANPSAAAAKKNDHACTKPKKLGVSSVLNSKLVPESEKSKPTSSHASEETAVSKPPDHTSKAKASLPNVAARETDSGASAKPNVSSVTDVKPIPGKVLQAQGNPVPPQAGKMVPPNQAPKAKTSVRAPTASTKAKAPSVTAPKPIPVRVSQAGEPALSQVPSEPDSKPIPVWVSQGGVQAHPTSSTRRKPASSQKKHSPGDEPYEDISDVPLEEYCDDSSDEANQVEQGVVFGEGREESQQPSCDKGKATELSDCEDVSDTPLTMYHSPRKSDNSVQPARRHAGEGVAKRPLIKKKVVGVKKAEEQKCTKVVEACHLPDQALAAKPKLVATNKVKAHLGTKQGAARLTALPPNGKHGGAAKRQLEWPGSAHHDVKKRKVDRSSEKSKPDPCPSSTQQNGSPSPGKTLAVKKIKKVVSGTKMSAKPSVAGTSNDETPKDSLVAAPSATQQNGSSLAAKKTEKEASLFEVSAKPSMTSLNNKETSKDSAMVKPSTTQQNGSSLPAKKLAAKKMEKEESCTKVSAKSSMTSFDSKETSKDSPMVAPKLEASKEVVAKNKKSEPTSAKTDSGHSSVTTPTHKNDSAKRKSTPPKKSHMAKSGKSTLPGKAAAMKLSKSPSTKAKGKTNGLPMTESSTNPQARTEEAPAKKQPQHPSSKVKVHTPSLEGTSTKACKPLSSSAVPTKHQDMSKAAETLDDPTQKARCSGSTEAALVCASPTSDESPGSSSLKQCHTSKTKESSSEATKTHKSFSGPAPTPRKREVEAKGTPCVVADGQPRDNTSQKPTGSVKDQKTTPVEKRCLDVSKGSQSCDTLQTSGIRKKAKPATLVKVSRTEGDTKNSDAAKKIGDRCDSSSTSNVAPERNYSAAELPPSGGAVKTKHPVSKTSDKAAKTTTVKEVLSKLTSGDAVKPKHPASKIEEKAVKATTGNEVTSKPTSGGAVKIKHPASGSVDKAAEATTDKDALSKPTSGSAVKTKHPASGTVDKAAEATTGKDALSEPTSGSAAKTKHPATGIVGKAVEHATNKEVLGTPSNDITCSSFSQEEPESMSMPIPTDKDATLPSEENMVEDQAEGLSSESKTAATSPRDGEGLKQAQEPSVVLSQKVQTDTYAPARQEADHISGTLLHSSSSQKSPADDATLVNRNCESLATSKGTSTLVSPSQERARDTLPLTQQRDDSSASIISHVSSAEQPRRKSLVPPELPAGARTMKQGDGNESPAACDNVSTQEPVEGADSSRKPLPSDDLDKRHDSTASTEERDGQTGEELSLSPPRQREGDCPMSTLSSNSGEQDACATLSPGDTGAAEEGPATSVHQDNKIKPSPLKKKNKNKGPGTNTSLRSSWLFSRKKRGKRQRRSTETPSGSSPKKSKAADSSQGSSSSEFSVSPTAIKKEPVSDVETEATLPSAAPPGQAHRSRDPKSAGNSAKKFKAAAPLEDIDLVAQGSSREFTGEPSTSLVKKEPGGDAATDAEKLFNAPVATRILRRLASPGVQASDRSPKRARSARSPVAGSEPLDPSFSANTGSAAVPRTPLEMAQMDLDMFTGLSILDVCGSGAEKLAELKEQLHVHSISKEEALDVVQKSVHKAVLDEYFKREHAVRTLNLLAKIPFSLDHAKVAKIQQLTRAIVATSEAGSKL